MSALLSSGNSGLIVFTNVGEVALFPVRAFRPFRSLRLGFQLSKRLYKQTVTNTQFLDFRFPGNYYHFSPFLISSSPGVPDSYILLSEILRPRFRHGQLVKVPREGRKSEPARRRCRWHRLRVDQEPCSRRVRQSRRGKSFNLHSLYSFNIGIKRNILLPRSTWIPST